MKTHDTIAGNYYGITSPNGCTVTDEYGALKKVIEAGDQLTLQAPGAQLIVDDDEAIVRKSNFNRAASVLGLLGGGVKDELPAGFLRAEFLERQNVSGHHQCIVLPDWFNPEFDTVRIETSHNGYRKNWLGCEGSYRPVGFAYGLYDKEALWMSGNAHAHKIGIVDGSDGKYHTWALESSPALHQFFVDGNKYHEDQTVYSGFEDFCFSLFEAHNDARVFLGKKRYWNLDVNGKAVARLLPVLDVAGVPCMLNTVDKGAHYPETTVNFIAGFTLGQARKLGAHLPATKGSLTVSLPTGYEQDSAVAKSLESARAKGWTLTIQTYTPEAEAAAATFGMRRIWVRRTQDEHGAYIDAHGVRWSVDWCVDMLTPDGRTPDEHGYELYRSTEAAVAYWELSAWVDPEAEELLTTESL